jgi:hypothetical protein
MNYKILITMSKLKLSMKMGILLLKEKILMNQQVFFVLYYNFNN